MYGYLRLGPVFILLICLAAVAPATAASGSTAATEMSKVDLGQVEVPTVGLTQSFAALPDQPGVVKATHRFDIPDNVQQLKTSIPSDATVIATSGGFNHESEDNYIWNGGSSSPSVTYRLPVNETGKVRGPEGADGEYRFVDVGEWGLFRRPPAPIDVTYRGTVIDFDRRTSVDGMGAAGDWLVFVGQATIHSRSANSQSFRLVEPAAADMAESPADVLESVSAAAGTLQVGARDETVLMIAAPTTVDWGVEGLQVGESDFYVTDDDRLNDAGNTWLHEYVHTRQSFNLTSETQWLSEATATYYASLLSLRQERISFTEFREALAIGTRTQYADTVLSRPNTWTAGSNYYKGALVTGELDRQLRQATNKGRSFQAVHRWLNERTDSVDSSEFTERIADLGSTAVGNAADQFTRTTTTPGTWNRQAHQDAFGELPSRISYKLPDQDTTSYRIAGPYRNETIIGSPFVLVTDERLGVELSVSNTGGTTGNYSINYGIVGGTSQTVSGTLDGGQTVVEQLWISANEVGNVRIQIGEFERSMVVVKPTTLEVTGFEINRSTVSPTQATSLTIDVRNSEIYPGKRILNVTANDEIIASRTVYLNANKTQSISIPVQLSTPGDYRLTVGNYSRPVNVRASETGGFTAGQTTAPTSGGLGSGMGLVGPVLTLLIVGYLIRKCNSL